MKSINQKSIYYIAKKEFLDNIRNKWVIILTTFLFLLVILFSYVAGSGEGFANSQLTVLSLIGFSSLIIELIAIILGCLAISGEAESGSFSIVLSYPITRLEILLGKFFGLGSVIVVSVLIGFGIGGSIITALSGGSWSGYFLFVLITIVMGLIYLSFSMLLSSIFKRRITSIGGGILIFFWSTIIGSIFFGILYGTGYSPQDIATGNLPGWYWLESFLSPVGLNQIAVMKGYGLNNISTTGFEEILPDFFNAGTIILAELLWLIIPLVLAYFIFKRRDI